MSFHALVDRIVCGELNFVIKQLEIYGKAAAHEKSLRLHLIEALLLADDDSVITFS